MEAGEISTTRPPDAAPRWSGHHNDNDSTAQG
jgi:hypothetical protein